MTKTAWLPIPITCLIMAMVLQTGCQGKKDGKGHKDAYEQSRESMEEIEKKSPARFLTVSGSSHRNLLGQTVVKGTVKSKATVVSYRDIELKLSFYSKTGALLEEDRETIYETIAPGKEEDFKSKYFAPKGTDSVALKVVSAKH